MKAAVVRGPGLPPVYGDFPMPSPGADEKLIKVTAAAISHLAKGHASGRHYSSNSQYPFVAGIDGVGRLEDGTRVYFALPRAPFGSMAEHTVAASAFCIPLPDGLDFLTAAAIANPGMSSWTALTHRAHVAVGDTVLINGATGTSGRLAVQIARHLGAGRIVATGRNVAALAELRALGADETISLGEDPAGLEARFMQEFEEGVDIVLDYLWGRPAECLLIAAAKAGRDAMPMRFVQVGSLAAQDITLPSAVLRAKAIELMGSGSGSVALPRLIESVRDLLHATLSAGLRINFKPVPFARFDQAWPADVGTCRTVFVIGGAEAGMTSRPQRSERITDATARHRSMAMRRPSRIQHGDI